MLRLTRLVLTDFRTYASLTWRPGARISVLAGPNGSGKTNLLEAISLLVPGRGLRGARGGELPRIGGAGGWAVAGRFRTVLGDADIGTGIAPGGGDRRVFRLDGAAPRTQAEIAARVAAVWLTPRMDRLFQEGLSGRRRFLDRLVWALEPAHARDVAAHDAAMAQRNRLLTGGGADPAWLSGLEDTMARHAVSATAARRALVARLNLLPPTGAFPAARIGLTCAIGARLADNPALEVEDWLRRSLAIGRARDAAAGGAGLGAHRADMTLAGRDTGIEAAQASTGQQKALLIGIVLSHAALIDETRGFAPLLLLDEPAVHLDAGRRAALFDALRESPAQIVLTGTDLDTFRPLEGTAEALLAGDGALVPSSGFRDPCPLSREAGA